MFFLAGLGWMLLSTAWGWATYAYWPTRHHDQTLGMRATRLRVVTLEGSPVGLGRRTLPWLLLLIDTNFLGLVALLTTTTSSRHQRLGDVATSTIVIRVNPRPPEVPSPPSHQQVTR